MAMSTGTGSLISAAALARQVCAMTQTQRDILLLLHDNNSICHVERVQRHAAGSDKPGTTIKRLLARGVVTLTDEQGDWGCIELTYVRLTSRDRQMVSVIQQNA